MTVPGSPRHHHVSHQGPCRWAQVGSETRVPVLSLSKVYISFYLFPTSRFPAGGKLTSSSVVVCVLEAEFHGA